MTARRSGPLLIVNADDYGLTEQVSRTIIDAHDHGIVTSTSVLMLAPAFEKTVQWLHDTTIGVGAHLALVGEDPPLLSAPEIPTLVDERGALELSWRTFLPKAALGRIDADDVRRELGAQMQRLVDERLVLDHIDTHQNVHLWPAIRRVVMELGELHDVRAVRITRSRERSPVGVVVRRLATGLQHACDQAGWRYPAASTGLDEAGHLDESAMIQAIYRLAATGGSSAELATHPGTADDADLARYEWDYQWADEGAALRSPAVRAAIDELGFRLGTFADLTASTVDDGPTR